MKVEIREDNILISGYVNAVERYSKPIREVVKGKIRTFIERIKVGVFRTAIKRNDDIKVLLNHNHDRILATTKDGSAKLEEDNIGLRAEVTIYDEEVIEKARNNQLVGWSFGFYANSDELGTEGDNETRTITDLDLIEVSILDDTKSPAYYGTSIEARAESEKMLEIRESIDEEETANDCKETANESRETMEEIQEEAYKKHEEIYEKSEEEHQKVEQEKKEKELELIVEKIVIKILENLNGTREEKTIPEETLVEEESREENTASIDYSEFEDRIAKLN